LSIESYFAQIQNAIASNPLVINSDIHFGKRSEEAGYFRGYLIFRDGTLFHFREYVDLEDGLERLMYSYHYMNADQQIIFRYDNVEHHPHISTFPHHKHDGSEEKITESPAPTFAQVLAEIERLVQVE
jgi:hypothetical protein